MRLEQFLEDDYLRWFDTPVCKRQRYADFIVFHTLRGLLLLEVKDWKLETEDGQLLLLYDNAQSIYSKQGQLGFSLSGFSHGDRGVQWADICILYRNKRQGELIANQLKQANIPHQWLSNSKAKKAFCFRLWLSQDIVMSQHWPKVKTCYQNTSK